MKLHYITNHGYHIYEPRNNKISEPHVLILMLTDRLDLRRDEKIIALAKLSIYYIWKNMKSSYNKNKFKISAPTWNDKFE